jgi:hypothetical protein
MFLSYQQLLSSHWTVLEIFYTITSVTDQDEPSQVYSIHLEELMKTHENLSQESWQWVTFKSAWWHPTVEPTMPRNSTLLLKSIFVLTQYMT